MHPASAACNRDDRGCAADRAAAIFPPPADQRETLTERKYLNGTVECWVLSDGKPGMRNQCVGLAEALGVEFVVKTIRPRLPWRLLPPHLWMSALRAPGRDGDGLTPPWPELLIATGRQTVAPSLAIKRASGGRTFTVQIQNPVHARARFDVIVAPRHDGLDGDNVIATDGALHRVTAARLADEADKFRPALAHLPRPLVAVLIGGANRQYGFSAANARRLADGLVRVGSEGAGLAITASRRTGAANERVLRDAVAPFNAYFWDGAGDNPYFGLLGLADAVVVTCDSVSMVSEACATGKPVHVFDLDGGSKKFRRFHAALRERGVTRAFAGAIESWRYAPLDDTTRVAQEIAARWSRTRNRD
jgi:mitochondrial fission protein ELM1